MFRPRIIPILLLFDKGLVKTKKFKSAKYVGDPINAVRILNDKFADELVLLDIAASKKSGAPDVELLRRISSEAFMPFAYGGGIQSLKQIETLFKLGIEKVVINTAFFSNPNLVREASMVFGGQSIVVSMDVKLDLFRRKRVFVKGGTINTQHDPVTYAKKAMDSGAGEIICGSIEKDGLMNGYDWELIESVAADLEIPVIAAGGAGSVADMKKVLQHCNASGAAAGSLFVFNGPHKAVLISYPDEIIIEKLLHE